MDIGTKIKHTTLGDEWYATVEYIDYHMNILAVTITNKHGYIWSESWNLEHTENGLQRGEYIEVHDENT